MKTRSVINQDAEFELIYRLTVAAAQAGVRVEQTDAANIYIALKHRPLAILAGPPDSGKCAFVKYLEKSLTGGDEAHGQVVLGHAWYAGGRPVNTSLVDMHSRLINEKLLLVIKEALQPENARQVFVIGLTHISPAELSFFTEVACQLQDHRMTRVGNIHLTEPVPFPPNLLLIGTMDTLDFDWWDEDLLSGATVIEWRDSVTCLPPMVGSKSLNNGCEFMRSSLRSSHKAYEKLLSVVAGTKQPLQTIMLVRNILQTHGLEFSPGLLDEVILYLANAWSQQGNGLFDPSSSNNLAIASDFALKQLVLPHYLDAIRSSEILQAELYSVLDTHLPRSGAFLRWQCSRPFSQFH